MSTLKGEATIQRAQQPPTKNDKQMVFFSLIEKLGSFGKYQQITIVFWCMIIFLCGELLFSTPFLFFQDNYNCSGLSPDINCKEYVCSLDVSERAKYFPDATIKSLAGELGDYRCDDVKETLDNIIAIMFFGIAFGYLLLTLFGELVGKKMLMLINLGCYIVGVAAVLLFYDNQLVVGGGLMVAVCGISNCYIICFMFLIETVESKTRERVTVLIQCFYGIGAVVNIFWYWLINDWWTIFFACYLIPAAVLFAVMCLVLVDTPMSLILRNSPEKALAKLHFIGRMNNRGEVLSIDEIREVKQKYQQGEQSATMKKVSVLQIFKYKSIRYLVLLLMLLQCTISFEFYAPSLMLSNFHFNMYINGLAVSLSQVIAILTASFFIRFKRRFIFLACFGCTLLCSVILIFIWDQSQGDSGSINTHLAILILIFLFQYSISEQYSVFYVYLNEVFPTQARMITISMISLTGGLATTFTPKITSLCLDNNFPVMIIFSSLSGLCILITLYLPETHKKVPKEVIDELQSEQGDNSSSQQSDLLTKNLAEH